MKAALGLLLLLMTPSLFAEDEPLLLDVHVNGQSIAKIGEFMLRDGELMTRRHELLELGFRDQPTSDPSMDAWISFSYIRGLTWRIDQATQTLFVTTGNDRLASTVLQVERTNGLPGRVESGTGLTLNYDLVSTFAHHLRSVDGSMDMRAFSPWGVFSNGLLTHAASSAGSQRTGTVIRLDSAYSFADVSTLRRYSAGDFITGGLGWTRPVRLGGLQLRSDFSMRPDLITFPLPVVSGAAAVPSTVDVLTNGTLAASGQVAGGPFAVSQLPVVTGTGNVSVVVTNALGQQVTINQPFYASSALLVPGLHTYSVQAGAVRQGWGSVSSRYGGMAGTATYRRGMTPALTVEGSAEVTASTVMAGAGGVLRVGTLGVVNLAAAGSAGRNGSGAQLTAGVQRIDRRFSIGANATTSTSNFLDVAAVNGDSVPRLRLNANTGVSLHRFGTLGAAYGSLDQDASRFTVVAATPAQRTHILSASYSLQVHHLFFFANAFQDLTSNGSGSVQFGVTVPFGRRGSASVSADPEGGAQVQLQKSVSVVGDWGYQGYLSAGDDTHVFGQIQHKGAAGLLSAAIDRTAGVTSLRMESQGALSFADKHLFASNTVQDSFAIVDTDGMASVRVLQENRYAGTSNRSGHLLVPDLRSFDINHLSIAVENIPVDATIDHTERTVRPQDRSGVVVRFPIRISHGALLRLIDGLGHALPVGSTATLRATGVIVPVGYEGEAYVQNLALHNVVLVERPDGRRCHASFDYHPVPEQIPTIGPLFCVDSKL